MRDQALRPDGEASGLRPHWPCWHPLCRRCSSARLRISVLFVLLPQISIWGCGALLIREAVRRGRRGWVSLLLLGLALAVAEECVVQQTSIAPLVGLASHAYGRVWGVNWVYFLWALGYESIWVLVLPVYLTELIFRDRRAEPWVARRGLALAGIALLLGSVAAWYSWTQVARKKVFHMPDYQPPLSYLLLALAAMALLVLAAFSPWARLNRDAPLDVGEPRRADPWKPRPWLVGWAAFAFGTPWCALVLIGFGTVPTIPFAIPTVAGIAWASTALFVMKRWISSPEWDDLDRFAVVFGGILACMAAGFLVFAVGGGLAIDWIGKAVLNLIAVLLLAYLGGKLKRCPPSPS